MYETHNDLFWQEQQDSGTIFKKKEEGSQFRSSQHVLPKAKYVLGAKEKDSGDQQSQFFLLALSSSEWPPAFSPIVPSGGANKET